MYVIIDLDTQHSNTEVIILFSSEIKNPIAWLNKGERFD